MFVILTASILLVLYFFLRLIVYVCRKSWAGVGVMVFILFVLPGLWYYYRISTSCDGWEYGFGGTKIDNDSGECRIETPHYCELQARRGILDLNRFFPKCSNRKMTMDRIVWPEGLKKREGIKRIGYGRPEKYSNYAK